MKPDDLTAQPVWSDDPVLAGLLAEAAADPETIALALSGSRSAGRGHPDSDYDVLWVLTDAAYARRQAEGTPLELDRGNPGGARVDLWCVCPRELARIAAAPSWVTPGLATSRVLLDKTGEATAGLSAIATLSEEKARADAAASLDAYLNGFYRSLKASRRGDELGARLEAAESAMYLVRTLFSLERQWPPYHDRLGPRLASLESQGWPPGYLEEALLSLLRTADPRLQVELEIRVESLIRARGLGGVPDAWGDDLENEKARYPKE